MENNYRKDKKRTKENKVFYYTVCLKVELALFIYFIERMCVPIALSHSLLFVLPHRLAAFIYLCWFSLLGKCKVAFFILEN